MLGRLQKLLAKQIAEVNKRKFNENLNILCEKKYDLTIDLHVVSMSGNLFFQDQLYSILSFVSNIGKPLKWTIYSDGTYRIEQIDKLMSFQFVEVIYRESSMSILPDNVIREHPFLKRLDYYANHELKGTTIFCDSDILFYGGFKNYVKTLSSKNWYLADESAIYFDEEYLELNKNNMYGVNAGFLVLNSQIDWNKALLYVKNRIDGELSIGHWTEQTAIHELIINDITFQPLDPRKFILHGKDSFTVSSLPVGNSALRHFVGPIRHKMWQYSWKKVLGI
jgi:hypothetical protein